jgi:hypothetical protein
MSKNGEKVGYKKPPKKHQFKKGQSGNPKGRPKINVDLKNIVIRELNKSLTIAQSHKKSKVTTQEVIVKKLVLKAAGGDLRALRAVLNSIPQEERRIVFRRAVDSHGKPIEIKNIRRNKP